MKSRVAFIIILAAFAVSCSNRPESLKVITLNIRYDNPADGINAWPNRKFIVTGFLRDEKPDLFGLQEALWHQYAFIDSSLSDYASVAAGRDDGLQAGEMAPLFYRKDVFDILDSGTFWLSETPQIAGSRGWGAVLPRIVTWASLSDRESGRKLFFFNTHFSHMSDSARVMSSRILRAQVENIAGDEEFIITGDFNMLPNSRAYRELAGTPVMDSYIESLTPPAGPLVTFNGFGNNPGEGRIDYIFVSPGTGVQSLHIKQVRDDSVFISDHWPVSAMISF